MRFERVNVVDMLKALGIKNISVTGSEAKFSCPFGGHSHGDEEPSACMNTESTAWICFGCKEKGNAVSFLVALENISPLLATRFLRERYEGGWKAPQHGSMRLEIEAMLNREELDEEDPSLPEEYSLQTHVLLNKEHREYMYSRGFTDETMACWQVGYDPNSRRITIPIRRVNGDLVGFKARTLTDEHPKYRNLGGVHYGFAPYSVSHHVFGLSAMKQDMLKASYVILCEGELDVMALWQMGLRNAVATGSNMSDRQCNLMREYFNAVTVFFDNDVAGMEGSLKVIAKLEPFMRVRVVRGHAGDPASMTLDEVNDALANSQSSFSLAISHEAFR